MDFGYPVDTHKNFHLLKTITRHICAISSRKIDQHHWTNLESFDQASHFTNNYQHVREHNTTNIPSITLTPSSITIGLTCSIIPRSTCIPIIPIILIILPYTSILIGQFNLIVLYSLIWIYLPFKFTVTSSSKIILDRSNW